jgi:hypothetical protein
MLILGLGKRQDGHDDAQELVEIMEVLMTEIQTAFVIGDAAAVDRIYNRMVRQMDTDAPARPDPSP